MLSVILSDYCCAFEGLFDTNDPVVAAETAVGLWTQREWRTFQTRRRFGHSIAEPPGKVLYPLDFDDVLKEYEDRLHEMHLSIHWDTIGHSMPRPLFFGALGSRGLGPKQSVALIENQETMLVFVRKPELNTLHVLVER